MQPRRVQTHDRVSRHVAPVRSRRAFATLRDGRKVRSGALRLTYVADSGRGAVGSASDSVCLAMAVPTRVGCAVVRNRLRRRVRAYMQTCPDLAAGTYFVQLWPEAAAATYGELTSWLERALRVALAAPVGTA